MMSMSIRRGLVAATIVAALTAGSGQACIAQPQETAPAPASLETHGLSGTWQVVFASSKGKWSRRASIEASEAGADVSFHGGRSFKLARSAGRLTGQIASTGFVDAIAGESGSPVAIELAIESAGRLSGTFRSASDEGTVVLARVPATEPSVSYSVLGKSARVPEVPAVAPAPRSGVLDVVIVGGGLSGLTTLYKLRDKKARLLEWGDETGGLASQATRKHVTYARGAAYFTRPDGAVLDLYRELGLGDPRKQEIREPIDSYWVNGRLVKDIWGRGLDQLPSDFRRFKQFLESLDGAGLIGEVPFESAPRKVRLFDSISAAELIEEFPRVKPLVDLYCRSALGNTSENVSALVFLNFYIDEIGPRYAFPGGTAGVTARLRQRIAEKDPSMIETGCYVHDVHHRPDGSVEVRYVKDGKAEALLCREAVVAAPVSAAARIVTDLPAARRKLFESVEHAHYLVHNVFTPELVFDKSYDTWVKGASFTDVIVGRWQEAAIEGKPVPRKGGVLTVYQPLPREMWSMELTDEQVKTQARKVLGELARMFPRLKKQAAIEVETSRWPQSIHITRPGLVTELDAAMRAPHGNVLFGSSNLGVPSFEEAIHRGLVAAEAARARLERLEGAGRPGRRAGTLPEQPRPEGLGEPRSRAGEEAPDLGGRHAESRSDLGVAALALVEELEGEAVARRERLQLRANDARLLASLGGVARRGVAGGDLGGFLEGARTAALQGTAGLAPGEDAQPGRDGGAAFEAGEDGSLVRQQLRDNVGRHVLRQVDRVVHAGSGERALGGAQDHGLVAGVETLPGRLVASDAGGHQGLFALVVRRTRGYGYHLGAAALRIARGPAAGVGPLA